MLCDDMRPFTRAATVCKHCLCLQADVGAVVLLTPRTFAKQAQQGSQCMKLAGRSKPVKDPQSVGKIN